MVRYNPVSDTVGTDCYASDRFKIESILVAVGLGHLPTNHAELKSDRSDTEVKVIISKIIQGESAIVPFEKYVTFNDLDSGKQRALWSLWFNCGYLTLDSAAEFRSNTDELHVCIPSSEIKAPQN